MLWHPTVKENGSSYRGINQTSAKQYGLKRIWMLRERIKQVRLIYNSQHVRHRWQHATIHKQHKQFTTVYTPHSTFNQLVIFHFGHHNYTFRHCSAHEQELHNRQHFTSAHGPLSSQLRTNPNYALVSALWWANQHHIASTILSAAPKYRAQSAKHCSPFHTPWPPYIGAYRNDVRVSRPFTRDLHMRFAIPVKISIISSVAFCISNSSSFTSPVSKPSKLVGILTSNTSSILDTKYAHTEKKQNHFIPFCHNCNYSAHKVSDDSSVILSTQILIYLTVPKKWQIIYDHIFTSIYYSHKPFSHFSYSTILSSIKSYPISYPMSSKSLVS